MSKRITDEELTAIRERAERATEGPWQRFNATDVFAELGGTNNEGITAENNDGWQIADTDVGLTSVDGKLVEMSFEEMKANAEFIAHARLDIPKLMAEVGRLRKLVEWNTTCEICLSSPGSDWRERDEEILCRKCYGGDDE